MCLYKYSNSSSQSNGIIWNLSNFKWIVLSVSHGLSNTTSNSMKLISSYCSYHSRHLQLPFCKSSMFNDSIPFQVHLNPSSKWYTSSLANDNEGMSITLRGYSSWKLSHCLQSIFNTYPINIVPFGRRRDIVFTI